MVDELLAGNAPFAFCGMRPAGPSRRAGDRDGLLPLQQRRDRGAARARRAGRERVLILDWDVHHGNGTNDIFHKRDDVLFASIHQSPLYPGTGPLQDVGSGPGKGFSLNLPVPPGSGEHTFVSLVQHVVAPAAREFGPQLVLVSAGYDAHADDPLAECELEDSSYGALAACVRELGGRARRRRWAWCSRAATTSARSRARWRRRSRRWATDVPAPRGRARPDHHARDRAPRALVAARASRAAPPGR